MPTRVKNRHHDRSSDREESLVIGYFLTLRLGQVNGDDFEVYDCNRLARGWSTTQAAPCQVEQSDTAWHQFCTPIAFLFKPAHENVTRV